MCGSKPKVPKSTPLPPAPGAPREGANGVLFRSGSRGIEEQLQAQAGADILRPFTSLLTMGNPVAAPTREAFTTSRTTLGSGRQERGVGAYRVGSARSRTTTTFDQAGFDRAQDAYQRSLDTLGSTPTSVSLGDGLLISSRRG